MTQHIDGTYPSASSGLTMYHQAWLPDGVEAPVLDREPGRFDEIDPPHDAATPKGVVIIVHGLGEHSGRYAHVAERLARAGYVVESFDFRGHGRSEGKRAYVRHYQELADDLAEFRAFVERRWPGRPLVMLGHSMGGNLAMDHVLAHQDGLAGLALSGPALKVGDDFSPVQLKVFKTLAKIAPGLRPQGLSAEAISRDPAVVEAYRADPLVYTGKISAGLGAALIGRMESFPAGYSALRLPILVQHGTEDQLTNVDGSRELERLATNANVTAHYYDGLFHEVFNEPEQERVLDDLVAWLDRVVPGDHSDR